MGRRKLGRRAWRCMWSRLGPDVIVAAGSHVEARAVVWHEMREEGYGPVWTDIWAWRAPEYDAWAAQDSSGACWAAGELPRGAS